MHDLCPQVLPADHLGRNVALPDHAAYHRKRAVGLEEVPTRCCVNQQCGISIGFSQGIRRLVPKDKAACLTKAGPMLLEGQEEGGGTAQVERKERRSSRLQGRDSMAA